MSRMDGAGGENRTPDISLTRRVQCHCATPARILLMLLAPVEECESPRTVLETVMLPLHHTGKCAY